ncbi:hypothetical protein L2E82_02727 [Cichorium intybus]|uniref:Uncharacterized protein n=1 Tax=Cichorium intybus TaxID=13427 RepID=A0ACB9H423_CICIN|nr:hypothetical protein L2E82_02727 [Cichorium intybus]
MSEIFRDLGDLGARDSDIARDRYRDDDDDEIGDVVEELHEEVNALNDVDSDAEHFGLEPHRRLIEKLSFSRDRRFCLLDHLDLGLLLVRYFENLFETRTSSLGNRGEYAHFLHS